MGVLTGALSQLRTTMRSLAVFLALIGVSLASQVTFLKFAQTFQKKYGSTEEYSRRREIFLQNYNDILTHNQLYEEGKVTWWRKITEHSDLTPEEFAAEKNLGMPPVDPELLTNTVDSAMGPPGGRGGSRGVELGTAGRSLLRQEPEVLRILRC